jgi:hypothetical protein
MKNLVQRAEDELSALFISGNRCILKMILKRDSNLPANLCIIVFMAISLFVMLHIWCVG